MVEVTNTKTLRQGIVTRILAIPAFPAGGRVFDYKELPTSTTQLPCVGVYSLMQRAEQVGTTHEPILKREIDIVIEAMAVHGTNAADDMLTAIKSALYNDATWLEPFDKAPDCAETSEANGEGESALEIGALTLAITMTGF